MSTPLPNNPLRMEQIRNPLVRAALKKISGLDVLEQWYDDWLQRQSERDNPSKSTSETTGKFIDYILGRLDVHADIVNEDLLDTIPKEGPIVFVANHPLGGLEGLLLTKILRTVRPDLKVLTNDLLRKAPEFRDVFIGVNVLSKGKEKENTKGIREVAKHLGNEGALLVFPAGTVSKLKFPSLALTDAPWNTMITRLARKYGAPIMPIFVEGRNSLAFYLSGYIHKRLRTLFLLRTTLNKSGKTLPLHIGAIIPKSDIMRLKNDTIATHYIRLCCKILKPVYNQEEEENDEAIKALEMTPIKQSIEKNVILDHLEKIKNHNLYSQGKFSLYCVPYQEMGPLLEQLAIERERTFRTVEEGTGKELDSDRFDPHYMHLFLWDEEEKRIAGGYRIGKTDEILEKRGLDGLYSHSLFDYNVNFLHKMGKTIELGRSFVTPEYQRHPMALDMLWKGIGKFVANNPEYHTLFGCVSISRQYSKLATTLLCETLLSHYSVDDTIQRHVKARTPMDKLKGPWTKRQLANLSGIPVINKLVGRIDSGKSIPILISHYLALNGRFVSFTVNEGFNRSLDGLIVVDLRKSSGKYLNRYMGEDGYQNFIERWKEKEQKDVA